MLPFSTASLDQYKHIYDSFKWEIPEYFNIGWACCGQWANDEARVALYYENDDGKTSIYRYAELQQFANRLSNTLNTLNVKRGDRVALLMPQRPEVAIAHIAIYQMGAVAMPLAVLFGPDALAYRFANSECVVAIVDAIALPAVMQIWHTCPTLQTVIVVGDFDHTTQSANIMGWGSALQSSDVFEPVRTKSDDAAVLIYTSGTTGPPKGALIPHRALLGNIPGFVYSQNLFPQTGDVFWTPADWAWTGGLMDALLPTLYFGYAIVGYNNGNRKFDPLKAYEILDKYGVTNTFLVPTALKMMMKAAPNPRQQYRLKLRAIMSAGEAVGNTLFAWAQTALGITLNEMFGQTEVNYIVGNCAQVWHAKPGCIGLPYPGHRVSVIDEAGNEVATDELGEIAAFDDGTDPVFFLGYWRNPQATEAKYSPSPNNPTGKWCRTGDLGKKDSDGYIWYQGRSDDMIKSAAYRIGPSEIENCLVKHPAVANAAVIGKPDELRGTIIKAFVVLASDCVASDALVKDIQKHVRSLLAPYQYPREIEFVDNLPMTTTGKIQRRMLRERG
jgi:acetyl-CoA synthetase